jgi:anti-sigma regulatory factor (Ser/Thr protein kinase)
VTFVHEALYYATVDEFLTGTFDFVQAGLAAGEPTLVVVPQPRLGLLQTELGLAGVPVRPDRSAVTVDSSMIGGGVLAGAAAGGAARAGGARGEASVRGEAGARNAGGARGEAGARGAVKVRRSRSAVATGGAPPGVWFADMAEVGRNPGRILPWVLRAFADSHPGRVRIIDEPIFLGRAPEELGPCVQHEALINVAFAGSEVTILCPYDTHNLRDMIAYAERTHPIIVTAGRRRPSYDYTDPAKVVALVNRPMREPERVDERMVFDLAGLAGVRRLVAVHAEAAGLAAERVDDLQLAVTEICTNAVMHDGDGLGSVRLWTDAGRVVCEIRGAGQILDIMAGRVNPSPEDPNGRGLLLANRLCDLVQTHTAPTGTMTRLYMRLSAS